MAALQIPSAPVLVRRIRKMLSEVDLFDAWCPSGPTPGALAWLSHEHQPEELTPAQWDVLLLAWAIWDAAGLAPQPISALTGSLLLRSWATELGLVAAEGR
jgi:hypothetical protein